MLDDYCFLPASRRAVDEFRLEHGITEPIEGIDYNGARWRRESPDPIPAPIRKPAQQGSRGAPAQHSSRAIPTARELELEDELAVLRARRAALEAEIDRLSGSPLRRTLNWARHKAGRGSELDRVRYRRDEDRGVRAVRRAGHSARCGARFEGAHSSREGLDLSELQPPARSGGCARRPRGPRARPSGRRDRRSRLLREAADRP